jgi:hypothetical protein
VPVEALPFEAPTALVEPPALQAMTRSAVQQIAKTQCLMFDAFIIARVAQAIRVPHVLPRLTSPSSWERARGRRTMTGS